jgi:hypothetical protein
MKLELIGLNLVRDAVEIQSAFDAMADAIEHFVECRFTPEGHLTMVAKWPDALYCAWRWA